MVQKCQKLAQQYKKLRDVLQEREGTSLNYFEEFSNYIEQFSWSISVYLALSYLVAVYYGLSWSIPMLLSVSQFI